ncbi:ATP-binding protein [Kitasatospora sp. NPDC096077]|uniref:sensor histidine kinase n=1 Tax=Kitasatospora sp. NPDC096077 TaxID=3155544 RepID=UPI0033206489
MGVTATHRVEGHRRPLPEELRQALLRIAREGMVNAVKHAPGAPIELVLAYRPGEVELTVANGSPTGAPSAPLPGSGLGLAGLTVLADKLGGSLRHGPSHGGHRLTATLPAP